ncbi:MAG: hypothetical protein M1819_005593 [Sarea resinae]|nr:MAG: hypothetical protein M1819_005593 [Sarea resinae]
MPLTILTDSEVRSVLNSLQRDDVVQLQRSLADALHAYSTGNQDDGCCSMYQPPRTSISPMNGSTTLFMPASTSTSIGMKIVTLSGSSTSTSISPSTAAVTSATTTPRGSLTLLDATGSPTGLLNAEELTAFRTALAGTLLFTRRTHVSNITVFGAGKQAYWHIRLALLLRGPEIKRVNIINRSFAPAQRLLQSFYSEDADSFRGATKFTVLTADYGEYARVLKEDVRKADVIFTCTPATTALFPPECLTSHEGRRKGRLLVAIGSYKPHMCELHPDILRQATAPPHTRHHHKHATQGGVVIVDSLDACLKEAGEIIQAGLGPHQLVEVGELMMLKKQAMGLKEVEPVDESSLESNGRGGEAGSDGLREWLAKGNVIYKSVGMGLMDLVVGGDVVALAREMGVGTTIEDF